MKNRAFSLLASIALLSFASCTDEMQELANEQSQTLKQIVMTTQDFVVDSNSRTSFEISDGVVSSVWAANDTVGVFPDEGAQAYFPMASGAGTKNASFDGKGWALKDGYTYASYYPYIGKAYLDRNAVPVSYAGQTQVGNASMEHLGAYDYMVATPTAPEFGSAQFMFKHLSALVQLKITIPEPATLTSVKLEADTKAFAVEGTMDIMADAPSIKSVTSSKEFVLNLQDVATTEANQVVTLYMMLPPADLSEQTLKAVVESDKGTQDIDLESKNFKAGTAYALSGELESSAPGYKDGVVTIAEAGTMKQLLGDNWLNITSLKVIGPINGDDVRCLRQMLGAKEFSNAEKGKMTTLDLSKSTIVEGGKCYFESYYTSNDAIDTIMFSECANLQKIVLPTSVTSIGKKAFYNCSSLSSITIGDSVILIGHSAFYGCSSLTSVYITDLSAWCNITFEYYTSNPLYYGAKFYLNNNELTEMIIPTNIKEIKFAAFYGCKSLTNVTIGNEVVLIDNSAFGVCSSLTSIAIGNSVTSIGENAFIYCSSLTSVYITDLSAWCNITFSNSSSNPLSGAKLYLNNEELTDLIIPTDVKEIKYATFRGCKSLIKVTIGDGITSIGNHAFLNCSSLTSVTIGNDVTLIDVQAFYDCSSLTSVTIGDAVASIDYGAFSYCSSLVAIDIPNSVTSIGEYAFCGCSSLISINIPDGITSIDNSTFSGCSSLESICIPNGVASIGISAFHDCYSLTSIDIPDTVTSLGEYAFCNCI